MIVHECTSVIFKCGLPDLHLLYNGGTFWYSVYRPWRLLVSPALLGDLYCFIKSTLKAAIDYILNPEKTDGKLLASSFGCGLETADIEFAWTREAAGDRGTHLGRHLIQSFAVGETTPEEAHKIGMELAQAVLGGKYEFTLKQYFPGSQKSADYPPHIFSGVLSGSAERLMRQLQALPSQALLTF